MPAGRFRWRSLLRPAIGFALLLFLSRSIGRDALAHALVPLKEHPAWIAWGLLLTFAALLTGVIRWQMILRSLQMSAPFSRLFQAYFIGQFFNAFLFGACGGDLVRAVAAAQDHPRQRPEAVTSVLLDRIVGLLITLLFGCLMLALRFRAWGFQAGTRPAAALMAVFLLGTLLLLPLLFARNLFERQPRLQAWSEKGRIGPVARRIYDALWLFRRQGRRLTGPILLSLLNLLLLAAATQALARALELSLPWMELLTVFPVVTVLAAVPLTPGSLGVRETLYIQLLQPVGIAAGPALMLSLLTYLTATFWSLFGLPFFLLHRFRTGAVAVMPPARGA